ncbi:hypothetical protein RQP46_000170 [Phenoliferia psychrophenolica]
MYDLYPDDPHSAHFAYPPPTNSHPIAMHAQHPMQHNPYYYAPTPPTSHGLFDAPLGHHQGWAQPPGGDEDHLSALAPLGLAGVRSMGPYGTGSDAGKSEDGDAGFAPNAAGKRAHGGRPAPARASSSAILRQTGGTLPTPPGPTRASSTSALPTSRSARASKASSGAGTPAYLAPDYTLNPAGPASSSTTQFKCPHEGCEKVYKGKHARSIWRRHLQDKHGIPLAQQPRRTRWDNDANRPKSEEERRARTLDSKRRWARKHRAERNGNERDGSVETSLGGSARDGSVDVDNEPWDMEDEDEDSKDMLLHDDDAEDGEDGAPPPELAPAIPLPASANEPWRTWRGGVTQPYKDDEESRRPLSNSASAPYPLEFATYGHSSAAAVQAGAPAPYPTSLQYQHLYYPPPVSAQVPQQQQQQQGAPAPQEPEFYHRTTFSPRHSFAPISPRTYGSASSYYNNPIPAPSPGPTLASSGTAAVPTQKDAAALVLLNLKTGCSSPSSPMVSRREQVDDDDSGDADTSMESSMSFSFDDSTATAATTRPTIKRSSSSPPSSTNVRDSEDSSEILLQRHALKRPPPPLPAMLESYTGLGSKRFRRDEEYGGVFTTSLVRTPTPVMRRAMASSPGQGVGEDDEDVLGALDPNSDEGERGGGAARRQDSDDRHDEDGDLDDDDAVHRGSPTRASKRPPLALGSSSVGLSNDLSVFAIASSDSSSARSSDAMPPPHPGSSSSVSSFHLSTPAGPAQGRHSRYDTFTRPFFPSSANSTSDIDRYYSTHLAMSSQQPHSSSSKPYHSRAPMGLSSPPGGSYSSYLFSSPAHPGISKQLGLTAQPGPGVLSGASGTPGREASEGVKGWGLEERTLPGIRELENRLGLGGRRYD